MIARIRRRAWRLRFPIPIELTQEELELAARGAFVTRVIYIEDPQHALPIARKANDEQPWIEAPAGEDPLVTADRAGRPVAILRIGSRVPNATAQVSARRQRRQWLCSIRRPFARAARKPPSDERMSNSGHTAASAFQAEHLPIWWRWLLIALATIILCSCSSPQVRAQVVADDSVTERTPAAPPITSVEMPADESLSCDRCQSESGCRIALDPYGPVPGPSDEYLCDGGDFVTPAGVTTDRKIVGLEPEDAISHYDTADGRVLVTPSNRVCIYAPRFAAVRRVVQVVAHEQPVFVNATLEEQSPAKARRALPPISARQRKVVSVDLGQRPSNLFRQRQQAGGLENLQAAMDAYTSLGAYANLTIIRTGEVSDAEKALLERSMQSAVTLTGNQAPQVVLDVKMAQAEVGVRQPGLIYQTNGPTHPKLRLVKLASCGEALPGEEIEFTLRFDNIGDQVISKVTIADNLTTRFEYVPGTAKSSVDADFITEANDVGSLVLRWEIKDPVKPGAGGILRFKVKVR